MVTVFAQPRFPALCTKEIDGCKVNFALNVERIRLIAYGCFFGFVLVGVVSTRIWVVDMLAEGPPPGTPTEKMGCGPFNRGGDGKDNLFDLTYGEGFDFDTQNHLLEKFGLSNICTYWDYTPSREMVAVVYPFFEFSLLMYITLDWFHTQISFKRGEIPKWYMRFHTWKYFLCMFLCTQFRLIFVFVAYENVQGHTVGFLCLQIALVLIAIDNFLYVLLTGQTYPKSILPLKTKTQVRACAATYLAGNLFVAFFKLLGTGYIVAIGEAPGFYLSELGHGGTKMGKVIDSFWMLFNAVIPFLIAAVRSCHEDPLTFEIGTTHPIYAGDESLPTQTDDLILSSEDSPPTSID